MGFTTEDFREFVVDDSDDDDSLPLGDALAEIAVDVETDSVAAVRDTRKHR